MTRGKRESYTKSRGSVKGEEGGRKNREGGKRSKKRRNIRKSKRRRNEERPFLSFMIYGIKKKSMIMMTIKRGGGGE